MGSRNANAVVLFGGLMFWSTEGHTASHACADAYEQAQELRTDGKLLEARRRLETCVAPSCSEFVRSECSRWLGEVEASVPTLVLAARRDGVETAEVVVYLDDQLLLTNLDGKAIAIDPGPHTLRFSVDGTQPIVEKYVFREGEKHRLIAVEFRSSPPSKVVIAHQHPLPSHDQTARRSSWVPYVLGGLGVAGVAGFAVLGLMGNNELADRRGSCAPSCSDAEVRPIRTKYHIADVSLGVGVVSLGVAGYMLLAPTRADAQPSASERAVGFDVLVQPNGGYATVRSRF